MSRLNIRWRLTLWYGAVLTAALTVFGASVFLLMRRELQFRTSRSLRNQLIVIEDQLSRTPDRKMMLDELDRLYARHPAFDIQVKEGDGAIWMRGQRILERGLPPPSKPPEPAQDVFENFELSGIGRYRMVSRLTSAIGTPVLVQVAVSLEVNDRELGGLLAILLLAGPLAVGCTIGGGYVMARQALAPVDRMAAAADQITASQLDHRLHTPNPNDELGRLARTLNGMIARLERSFAEVRQFTADAAHELRTPLAILRNEAEVALRVPRDSEQYCDCLENMLEEIDHLSRLSEALLFLFREDAGLGDHKREILRIDEIVCEIVDHMRVVAAEKLQVLTVDAPVPCKVLGNAEQLRRLLFNLLDNALNFTAAQGSIQVRVEQQRKQVRVVVVDTGIGIAPEHLPRVFDRFYQVDSARSQGPRANGLGLSICRSIAEAHHGSIKIESQPGKGTRVTLTLPGISEDSASLAHHDSLAAQGA
jgi:heavy metal sensor kinase